MDPLKEEDEKDVSTAELLAQEMDPLDNYHNEDNIEASDDDDDYVTENECEEAQLDVPDDQKTSKNANPGPASSKTRSKFNEKEMAESILSTLKLDEMPDFKKTFVSYLIKKKVRIQAESEGHRIEGRPRKAIKHFDDPLRKYCPTYNSNIGTLDLCGIKLDFIEEEDSALQCSECGHKFKICSTIHDMEKRVYGHVLGEHLKLLQCPHCPSTFISYSGFRQHVLAHTQATGHWVGVPATCDVCGKPLSSKSLSRHKWSHMSEGEKAEARRLKGMEPLETEIPGKRPKPFQCDQCGKNLSSRKALRNHQLSHDEQRTMHMCESCGKSFTTKYGMIYHRKFKCLAGKEEVSKQPSSHFQCAHCPKNFPQRGHLNRHVVTVHSKDKYRRKCEVCGKCFITPSSLGYHMVAHSDARPFSCEKGCGTTFKDKRNMRKHQIKCSAAINTGNLV